MTDWWGLAWCWPSPIVLRQCFVSVPGRTRGVGVVVVAVAPV